MTHRSDSSHTMQVNQLRIDNYISIFNQSEKKPDVCLVILPPNKSDQVNARLNGIDKLMKNIIAGLKPNSTLITVGETIDLVKVHTSIPKKLRYQLWIALKRKQNIYDPISSRLPNSHFGALVHTEYKNSLKHVKTRLEYTYCPVCEKTTKDYGGKKHTYHDYGTLISDVWRDIDFDFDGDLTNLINRFADILGIEEYQELRVLDCRSLEIDRVPVKLEKPIEVPPQIMRKSKQILTDKLFFGDSLEELKKIPNNSIDFTFADPPYNLGKHYTGYFDDRVIEEYFLWCDEWLTELSRILKPGRTCAILNIPLWAIRHFTHMEKILKFQNWIVWDALSFPVRLIMPAHYTILCFSKGTPRPLPGLVGYEGKVDVNNSDLPFKSLEPLADDYCVRAGCVNKRISQKINDRSELSDIWSDIHRLKHNIRRVDHPCQLPPQLMYRLISLFTKPGDIVLDCFNGAGTTTLAAHQLDRHYIGIEIAEIYHQMALERHNEILQGMDPFRKQERMLTAKNSPVPRLKKQNYEVPKKTLQLEVRRICKLLGHLPSRDEVSRISQYPIEYYDNYFISWGEVCAAARTTGMSEYRTTDGSKLKES
ncbi:MAG: hypothetical protein STSR0009_08020 [Methanoregula sp.]